MALLLPLKIHFVFADHEITRIENFGHDVNAISQVEVDEIRRTVLYLVQSWFFLRRGSDVSKPVVVINGRNEKRLLVLVKAVVELQPLGRIVSPETLFVSFGAGCGDCGLRPQPVNLTRRYKLRWGVHRLDNGLVFRLDEHLEVGIITFPDLFHEERIHLACRGSQRDIRARTLLGWLYVAEVLRSFDNPEVLIAGDEIEDLLVLR